MDASWGCYLASLDIPYGRSSTLNVWNACPWIWMEDLKQKSKRWVVVGVFECVETWILQRVCTRGAPKHHSLGFKNHPLEDPGKLTWLAGKSRPPIGNTSWFIVHVPLPCWFTRGSFQSKVLELIYFQFINTFIDDATAIIQKVQIDLSRTLAIPGPSKECQTVHKGCQFTIP